LKGLKEGRQVDVLRFDTFIVDFVPTVLEREAGKLAQLKPEVRKKLETFVGEAKPAGQTFLSGVLKAAFQYEDLDTIYLLTDGAPTYGITNSDELLSTVARWNRRRRIKINTIGVDLQPAEKGLLRSLADQNYGVFVER
jgi:hypothetical protein